jgi:uroporphyrinogen-III synthase
MKENKARILCTRPLDALLVEQAARQDIIIESLSFISTQVSIDERTGARIADLSGQPIVAVFTSMNAVEAVAGRLAADKNAGVRETAEHAGTAGWTIFGIGAATRRLASENFGEDRIAGTAGSAGALAAVILGDPAVREVVFFCGDQRRDELPDQLRQAGLRVEEVIVYHTTQTPHKADPESYDAVIFFSPSAVHSFFSDNPLPAGCIPFAIGDATAEAIRHYSENEVIVSGSPDKEALVRQAIGYFQKPPSLPQQEKL